MDVNINININDINTNTKTRQNKTRLDKTAFWKILEAKMEEKREPRGQDKGRQDKDRTRLWWTLRGLRPRSCGGEVLGGDSPDSKIDWSRSPVGACMRLHIFSTFFLSTV